MFSPSFVLLICAGILWGTGGMAGSLLHQQTGLSAISIADYRLLLSGGLAAVALSASRAFRRVPRGHAAWQRIVLAGGLLAQFQCCYLSAVTVISVGMATLITIGSVPIFITGHTMLREGRLPPAIMVFAVVVTCSGLVLLTGSAPLASSVGRAALGIGLCLAAGVGFAVLTVLRPVEGLTAAHTTVYGFAVGGVLLLPPAAVLGMRLPMTGPVLATALGLGALPTALAYLGYLRALRTAHPVAGALCVLLEPLTATVLSVIFLGERLTGIQVCGAGLLIIGLALGSLVKSPT